MTGQPVVCRLEQTCIVKESPESGSQWTTMEKRNSKGWCFCLWDCLGLSLLAPTPCFFFFFLPGHLSWCSRVSPAAYLTPLCVCVSWCRLSECCVFTLFFIFWFVGDKLAKLNATFWTQGPRSEPGGDRSQVFPLSFFFFFLLKVHMFEAKWGKFWCAKN